jgi:glycerol-3-phosphate cytidylyltransferase
MACNSRFDRLRAELHKLLFPKDIFRAQNLLIEVRHWCCCQEPVMKTLITYGTFDLFHVGHARLLERLKAMGDYLIVGVSTDEFNARKGKRAIMSFEDRCEVVRSVRHVDLVIPENDWSQKIDDVLRYKVDVFAIGDDWAGKFDELKAFCEVVYLPRTVGVSSTMLRSQAAQRAVSTLSAH